MTKLALLMIGCFLCHVVAATPPIPEVPASPSINSSSNTYHVHNELGNDSNNDGSEAHPWKSLKFAAERLRAGDALVVHGTKTVYPMDWASLVHSGSESQWITIIGKDGVNGERVTFSGRLSFGSKSSVSISYVRLKNILFQGPGSSGLNIIIYQGSHHLVFEDIEIDCQSSPENNRGLWTDKNVHHVWFKDMTVHHCGYKRNTPTEPPPSGWKRPTDCGGICVKGGNIDEVVFLNVVVSDNVGDGIGGGSKKSYGSSYFKDCISERNTGDGFDPGGSRAIIINTISRNNGGHQGAGFKFWSKESWLVNSVAYNNDSVGLMVRPRHEGKSHIYILNNTFAMNNIDRYGGQIFTAAEDPANGKLLFYIHNNIFYGLNSSAIVISNNKTQEIREESHNYYLSVHDSVRKSHWTSAHAIHYRDGNKKVVRGYTFAEMAGKGRWNNETGNGTGNIGVTGTVGKLNPGFVDLANGDLRLAKESQAIDGGVDVGVLSDINGTPVPVGDAPDMGAYEFHGGYVNDVPTL